jgi:hypothetical protein
VSYNSDIILFTVYENIYVTYVFNMIYYDLLNDYKNTQGSNLMRTRRVSWIIKFSHSQKIAKSNNITVFASKYTKKPKQDT